MVPGGPLEWQTILVTPKYHLLQHHIENSALGFSWWEPRDQQEWHKSMVSNVISARLQVALPVNCSVHVKNSGAVKLCLLGWGSGKVSRRIIKKLQPLSLFFKQGGLTAVTPVASNQWVYICVTIYLKAFLFLLALIIIFAKRMRSYLV